jgi:hypothetical protein
MPAPNNTATRRYLDLLRHPLCRDRFPDARYDMSSGSLKLMPFDPALRAQGRDWPLEAVTMVGTKRWENLENCCCTALEEGIPGDFVESRAREFHSHLARRQFRVSGHDSAGESGFHLGHALCQSAKLQWTIFAQNILFTRRSRPLIGLEYSGASKHLFRWDGACLALPCCIPFH